ncbi:MAG: AIR synthase-related protein, partial [Woeseiales bacterium]
GGASRLGASCLAQVYQRQGGTTPDLDEPAKLVNFFSAIQLLSNQGLLLAYHDRSDGGLLTTIAEMMFAGHLGASLQLAGSELDLLAQLFNEELGAVVQVADANRSAVDELLESCGVDWVEIGKVEADNQLSIYNDDALVVRIGRLDLQ